MTNAYGSSNFGTWIEDEFGLPAFQYTCNQTTDPRAVTQVQPGVLTPTEHVHQVGNDRITALASNYGHVRVRQDEGCPKFLNDVDPETHQFGWRPRLSHRRRRNADHLLRREQCRV